ncbi:M20/M25/M40 family metallo-hydrolase [candidate division KSB1 bacterium]|nr:M20/M25/M40 family metallo-hydrolase [candidate division KSB1 bacterium]
MRKSYLVVTSVLILAALVSAGTNSETTVKNLKAHLEYLASDDLQGRGIGTEGIEKAAHYIADQFTVIGLEAGFENNNYFQPFEITVGVKVKDQTSLLVNNTRYRLAEDYTPLGISSSAEVSGVLAFVGYGITAPEYDYNDYASIDVAGKIALVLTAEPSEKDSSTIFAGIDPTVHSELRNKANLARENGAAAVIFIDGPRYYPQGKELPRVKNDMGYYDVGIPVLHINQSVLYDHIPGDSLLHLQQKIDARMQPASLIFDDVMISLRTDLSAEKSIIKNVVGVIRPTRDGASEYPLIIGAHYDHLGYGGPASLAPGVHEVHNGADDNASGVAAMLEIARNVKAQQEKLVRPLVFIAFSGEEIGLIGSSYYVKSPIFPIENTIAMLNLDAVGRMQDDGLIVFGTGTAQEWTTLMTMINKRYNFKLTLNQDGYGPSDHASFVVRKIPVLHFFTGANTDYHKPSDDVEKINFPDLGRLADFITDISLYLTTESSNLTYVHQQIKRNEPAKESSRHKGARPWLGTVPDFSYQKGDGFRLNGVSPGSPCESAGLASGDIITKIDDMDIRSIYDLMNLLNKHAPGDIITIYFKRDDADMVKQVTLGKR